jgi:four helix bundle protein
MIDKKKIERFEDMQIWNDSQDFVVEIYKITKKFPKEELYALTIQMRRACSSISANIAEGFGRGSNKDKSHFYHIALGSLLETKNFVYLSSRLKYMIQEDSDKLVTEIDLVNKQITAILKYFKENA